MRNTRPVLASQDDEEQGRDGQQGYRTCKLGELGGLLRAFDVDSDLCRPMYRRSAARHCAANASPRADGVAEAYHAQPPPSSDMSAAAPLVSRTCVGMSEPAGRNSTLSNAPS